MKRYFTTESAHGSESSHGFSNDTIVRAFDSQNNRDTFIAKRERNNLTLGPIPRREVGKAAANYSMTHNRILRPQPFTTACWIIQPPYHDEDFPGYLGTVEIGDSWHDKDIRL